MKKQFIGIDRDGCLVGYLGEYLKNSPSQYTGAEMPLILPVIEKLKELGLPIVIFSNQAGIESGYTTLEVVINQFHWLMKQLESHGVKTLYSMFCPDKEGDICVVTYTKDSDIYGKNLFRDPYRKPDRGMGDLLMSLLLNPYHLDPLDIQYECKFYIGDLSGKPDYSPGCKEPDSDLKFAQNMGWDYLDVQDFLLLN